MANENSNTCTHCPMKPIRKEWLEFKVIKETMEFLFQHAMFENVAQQLIAFGKSQKNSA